MTSASPTSSPSPSTSSGAGRASRRPGGCSAGRPASTCATASPRRWSGCGTACPPRLEARVSGPRAPPEAVVLVRNDVTVDARVRREVDALRVAGFAPLVVGVATARAPERNATVAGAPLVRLLGPRARAPRPLDPPARRAPRAPAPPLAPAAVGRRARAGRTLAALRYYRRALGIVARRRPSLLHCNDHNTMWVGVASRLLWRTPVVYDAHELWPNRNGRWEWRPGLLASEWTFVRAATATITASP